MKLPESSAVPQWLLDMVAVAPEEIQLPTDPQVAKAHFGDLRNCLQNPYILHTLAKLAVQVMTKPVEIEQAIYQPSGLYVQQQMIGEARGLRATFGALDEIHTQLRETAQSVPQ